MITVRGKGIAARALAGQVASAFSYIAVGVGAQPQVPVSVTEASAATWTSNNPTLGDGVWGVETDTELAKVGDGATAWNSLDYTAGGVQYEPVAYMNKNKLDFEAFRVPISSSSVVFEGGKTKIVFAGTLPSAQRYEISEIGLYSAEFNPLLVTQEPRMLYTFSDAEGWAYHSGTITDVAYLGAISTNNLDVDPALIPAGSEKSFFLGADNSFFFTTNRKNQRMRVYQDAMLLRGDLSTIDDSGATWAISGDHVHVTGIPINLTKAREDDEIKMSFASINANYADISPSGVPAKIKIAVRFRAAEDSTEYATLQVKIEEGETSSSQVPETTDLENNGYYSVTVQKKDLVTTANFSWETVTVAQVFVDVDPQSGSATDHYVAIDAMRFDSNNDNNPAYGLTAYSVIQNSSAATEIKELQTESQIDYRVTLEV